VDDPVTGPEELPPTVRVFPLGGAILLPRAVLPLNIFEPRYLAMVRDAMAGDRLIAIVQPRGGGPDDRPDLYEVAGLGRITQFSETGDGRYLIALSGLARMRIVEELPVTTPYRQVRADHAPYLADWHEPPPLPEVMRADLEAVLQRYLDAQNLSADWEAVQAANDESLVNTLAAVCPFEAAERQALLEAPDLAQRTRTLTALMRFAADATGAPSEGDPTVQ
jgi:Lon protease-like protein